MSLRPIQQLEDDYFDDFGVVARDNPDDIIEFLEDIYEHVEQGTLQEGGYEYEDYLTRFASDTFWHTIDDLLSADSIETDADPDDIRFGLFVLMAKRSILPNPSDFNTLSELDEEYRDSVPDRPTKPYFRSLLYRYGYEREHRQTGLQLAHEAVDAQIENPSIYDNFAAQIVEVDEQFGIESLDLDIGDSDVSELALEYAEKAVRQDSTEAEYYATLGRVYSLRGELDEAERNVQRAIELRLDEETQGQPNTASFRSILRTIKSKRQIQKIESQYEEAQDQLEEISEKHDSLEKQYESLDGKYDSIESKLEDAVEKYRTQTLQFIGFFTALLAVVVTSVQVTEITSSVSEARSLIITLIGGILVSFGGFSLMLPDKESGYSRPVRIGGIILIGTLLLLASIVDVPYLSGI
ncbi:tetratricopeptide repeat protein [Salarchaeum japonicum]|uniref:tetratricopeptide repeat protein n=1 Tax=Salarchaeum japonicum TaxID=555573 RepID=UPI003C786382